MEEYLDVDDFLGFNYSVDETYQFGFLFFQLGSLVKLFELR